MKSLRDARLVVFSHKLCWRSGLSPTGFATDGGFPIQMGALAEAFGETRIVVPVAESGNTISEAPLAGPGLRVIPLTPVRGRAIWGKLAIVLWFFRNLPVLIGETVRADAVHAPVPGDVGTIGMLLGFALGKPLLVRHCGNWANERTTAERFWKWFMERFAGGRNVMLATGGASHPPSARNPNVSWIFSTSLRDADLKKNRAACERTEPAPRLIIVCRQEHAKGTGVVIEALPILAASMPGIHFDVVGGGGALPAFKALAARTGVSDRVTFHGAVGHQRVLELLRQAGLFCFPTASSEGFPKAVLEAMSCGLPIVTTPVSVLPALLAAGGGLLIEKASPDCVAGAVRHCLSDAGRYREMSRQALLTAAGYSLERWRDTIAAMLVRHWKSDARPI